MHALSTSLDGLLILESTVFEDERGFLLEAWSQRAFRQATGVDAQFLQDNLSGSWKNVLRGLHYQLPPRPQGKLVRVTVGSVFDVAVDVRRSSATFGQWFGIDLSSVNHTQIWIPAGFAHGFVVTSDWAQIHYKVTEYYSASDERVLRWDDPEIGIAWPPMTTPTVSSRDLGAMSLAKAEVFP
jgi:dTDP-4-dehydrorhamnose 3,5-epimerase